MSENNGEKQRLLIVDDSKVIRVTARKILQNHFATVEAVDGTNAWEVLNAGPAFSLVVSDLTMPNMDGFELLDKIRNSHEPDISGLPVIIITGANDSESTMQRARDAGATDFIGKPFDAVHLLARTQSHANAYHSRRTLTAHSMSLEDQALVDRETGLANEAAFMERGYQQLSYAIRHNSSLAVAQIEIDFFGDLFKQHGATATGMVLKYAASVLESGIRQEDLAARIGAARFAVLLPAMDHNGIRRLADRIMNDIRNRIVRFGNRQIHFTVSVGIAAPDIRQNTRLETLVSAAGSSLRDAVSAGGNRVVIHGTGDIGEASRNRRAGLDAAARTDPHATGTPGETDIDYTSSDRTAEAKQPTGQEAVCLDDAAAEELPEIQVEPVIEYVALEDPVQTESVVVDFTRYQEEEEILITAPYSLFEDPENAGSASHPSAMPADAAEPTPPAAQGVDAPDPDAPLPAEAADDAAGKLPEIEPEQRPAGRLRRMLNRIFHTGR
jgi:diguanylate cyclase (GGDEF)-like protein